jgi:hypothetical protein
MFEQSQQNLKLFALEPILSFAEQLIGNANGVTNRTQILAIAYPSGEVNYA